jgi:1-acyl-sn-glycerol-3-phosphate acyltransferase
MIQKIWFTLVWSIIKLSLFFYSKKITVVGKENIPKKGAVIFVVNHPNGLIDPLYVTTTNKRQNHFLVRAASFKHPIIKKILSSLYLMPIFRIRDGIQQLANNQEIFEKCHAILKKKETLMIFPEGSHSKRRTIRLLNKGFTRIVFGALEKHKDLEVLVIPVGVTYQHLSDFPAKVSVHYGVPIASRTIYESHPLPKSVQLLKEEISKQLKTLSVHIPDDHQYESTLQQLNKARVDFTSVAEVNEMIRTQNFPPEKAPKRSVLTPLLYLIKLNSIVPYLIWKKALGKIKEIEFIDTFRFGLNLVLFSFSYAFQTWIMCHFLGNIAGFFYLTISALLILIYVKCTPTNAKKHRELN